MAAAMPASPAFVRAVSAAKEIRQSREPNCSSKDCNCDSSNSSVSSSSSLIVLIPFSYIPQLHSDDSNKHQSAPMQRDEFRAVQPASATILPDRSRCPPPPHALQ